MKKITVTNIKTLEQWEATLEDETEWINFCLLHKMWGKSERWVRAKILDPNRLNLEIESFIYPEEVYSDNDIIDSKIENQINFVKLKSEYVIEIINLGLDFYRDLKKKEILNEYEKQMNLISSKYPQSEREGWAVKKSQAEKWLSSTLEEKESLKLELLMLVSESKTESNEDITVLANAIIRDSNLYQVFYGTQTKNKRNKIKQIENASTLEEINSINY